MAFQNGIQFKSLVEFWEYLPPEESLLAEILRQIIIEKLPLTHKEKLCYNVPYFYLKRRVCFIWPAAIPTNKQVFYKIYKSVEEINATDIQRLIIEAIAIDETW